MASLLAGIPQAQTPDLGGAFMEGRQAVRTDQNQGLQLQQNRNATTRDTNSLIAQYAVNADTPEKWQQAMADLQQAGVPDATQFADKFNLRDTIIQRAYSAADQMNSRTAGQFLGSLPQGTGTLSSLPTLGAGGSAAPVSAPGASLSPGYLASLGTTPPQGAAPPVSQSIPSRPDAAVGNVGSDTLGDGKLPPALVSQESGGRQFAANGQPLTSSAGAIGVAQVMPGTAPEAAQMAGVPFDEQRFRSDPAYNQQLGAAYYDAQMKKYGDPALAAAAYNAGPGRVDEYLSSGRPLPAETIDYVQRVAGRNLGGNVRPATRDIQAPAPNGVPVNSLQILAQNPTYAGTAINAAISQYGNKSGTAIPLTAEQAQALGFAPGTVVQRKTDGTLDVVQKPSETGASGPFQGTALDAQDSNILIRGNPASPEYAMAYQRQYMTPKILQIPDPNNPGQMMSATVIVAAPPSIRPPAGMQPAAAASAPAQGASQNGQAAAVSSAGQTQSQAVGPGGISVQPIPGTSRGNTQPIPAEVAARIGLTNQFLDNDLPGIRQAIQGGAMDGLVARGQMATNAGTPGVIIARIKTGVDALRRNLTGAGMSASEAEDYVSRYQPELTDGSDRMGDKLNGLEADLKSVRDAVLAGRSPVPGLMGKTTDRPGTIPGQGASQPQPGQPPAIRNDDDYNALPPGAEFIAPDGTHRRKP